MMLTLDEQTKAYKHAYSRWRRAVLRNDAFSPHYGEEPDPEHYGLTGQTGEWLADRVRTAVQVEEATTN